ncbi:Crp/Fnr family transcriptional regulator [Suttonella sp. R2A3]|uniref:Crp/Fnr family transcriptional regulator n=1 Tax=Suttonella sp. R2A3 TaxID=2908648 RepID=UPI001F42A71B|nr:Crp/Fnr family transcriptional regulator [Suttonella sp. R2A3]UJF24428.1 Crp/Fnr family transcriptional regulator [Suttonella sp. R2A3]
MPISLAREIAKHYLFSALSDEERDILLKDASKKNLAANSLIFQKGDAASTFYFIIKGEVRIYFATPDGREKTIRTFSKQQSFADAVMFMHHDQYPANAATISDCELLAIRIDTFRRILEDRPRLYSAIIGHLIQHIQILSGQVEMLSVMDSKQRLLRHIKQLLPPNWQNKATYPISMSKKDLANHLAMRPETLSRTLRQIEDDGILIWGKDGVTLIAWPPHEQ